MSSSIHTVSVGDWSADGHGQHEKYMVSVPDALSEIDLDAMVTFAETYIGKGSLHKQCEDYEDSSFSVSLLAGIVQTAKALDVAVPACARGDAFYKDKDTGLMKAMDWDSEGGTNDYNLEDPASLDLSVKTGGMDSETFFGLWIMLANIGLALSKHDARIDQYTSPRGKKPKSHRIGGYGLFFN